MIPFPALAYMAWLIYSCHGDERMPVYKTVLKRHDYLQYIAERMSGDFACTLSQHLEHITAECKSLMEISRTIPERRSSRLQRRRSQTLAVQPPELKAAKGFVAARYRRGRSFTMFSRPPRNRSVQALYK